MTPDDPRHGTVAGYHAHSRAKVPHCQPCRDAIARYNKARLLTGWQPTIQLIDATGTRRRIHALAALGYLFEEIADACGWPDRRNVFEAITRDLVEKRTHDRVAAAYDRLSMTLPPDDGHLRDRQRAQARSKGWLPPLALDDDRIDDPGYRPTKHLSKTEREQLAAAGVRTDYDEAIVLRVLAGRPRPRQLTPAEAAEAARRLLARGVSTYDLEHTYGLKADRYTTQTPAAAASTPAAAGHTTTDQSGDTAA